jgi:hypothetical protein
VVGKTTKAICPGFSPHCSLGMDVVTEPACRVLITIKHAYWFITTQEKIEYHKKMEDTYIT